MRKLVFVVVIGFAFTSCPTPETGTPALTRVDNPNQYDSISWSVNGTAVTGPSFP